jgi:hypothetical protein
VITVNSQTKITSAVRVKELTTHDAKNYALTSLVLIAADSRQVPAGTEIHFSTKVLRATPNHPMMTREGNRKIGEVREGQEVLCLNEVTGKYDVYQIWKKEEHAGGTQQVYNIVAEGGNIFVVKGVVVMQNKNHPIYFWRICPL